MDSKSPASSSTLLGKRKSPLWDQLQVVTYKLGRVTKQLTVVKAKLAAVKKRKREHAMFLVVDAKLALPVSAALGDVTLDAIKQSARRKRADRRKTPPPLPKSIADQVKQRAAALLDLRKVQKLVTEHEDSALFTSRMKTFVAECSESINISMYSLTHDELTQALVDCHDKGDVTIRVIVDHRQMHLQPTKVRKLIKAGIAVWVHQTPTFMMHDKFAIFDGRILAHGSVNWSGHAMISGGLVAIHDDERLLLPVVAYFEDKMKSYRLVEEHELLKICKWCARYRKASGRRAEQKKKRAG